MLSAYTAELGRRSAWTCLSCSSLVKTNAVTRPITKGTTSNHTRRHSSSKTTTSAKQDPRNIANAKVVTDDSVNLENSPVAPNAQEVKRSTPRVGKRKAKESSQDVEQNTQTASTIDLPSVPSTQNLHPLNIHLASFFSTHRPLSITNAIPPAITDSAFSSLFEAKHPMKTSPADVIHTLSTAVDVLENGSEPQLERPNGSHQSKPEELDLFSAVAQALQPTTAESAAQQQQISNLPAKQFHINLQDLAKNFRPYSPPPPPIPLAAMKEIAAANKTKKRKQQQPKHHKTYKTTFTIHELTDSNGNRVYETHTAPMIEQSKPTQYLEHDSPHYPVLTYPNPSTSTSTIQPFLTRMLYRRWRQQDRPSRMWASPVTKDKYNSVEGYTNTFVTGDGGGVVDGDVEGGQVWELISVKRQRKLKMKKHKYKKLLKRTKTIRRKLDRT